MVSQTQYLAPSAPWRPGFMMRLPWLGFLALLASMLCIIAAILVLIKSDLRPVDQWTWQPSVYLNILSTVANFLLPFSFAEALKIAWWLRAAKADTKVKDLHRIWSQGTNFLEALAGLRHFSLIALGSIIIVLTTVNGPLLQRASTTELVTFVSQAATTLDLSPGLSGNWSTGYISNRADSPALFTSNFTPIVQNWITGTEVYIPSNGCSGTCGPARVRGVGFAANCSSNIAAYNLNPIDSDGSFDNNQPAVHGFDVLGIYFYFSPMDGESTIQLGIQYKNSESCAGDLQIRNCTLRAAAVEYPLIIDGQSGSIALDSSTNIFDDTVDEIYQSVKDYPFSGSLSAYGGLALALADTYNSVVHMDFGGAISYELVTTGSTGLRYASLQNQSVVDSCALFFRDPTSDLLAAARQLMFRTSVAAANGSGIQTISMPQSQTVQVFATHYLFLGLAAAASAVGFITTAILFFGYHRLGRSVSLNPIEIAKAFGAPVLAISNSNANASALLKEVGHQPLRYGAVTLVHGQPVQTQNMAPPIGGVPDQLLFARPDCVRLPQPGEVFAG